MSASRAVRGRASLGARSTTPWLHGRSLRGGRILVADAREFAAEATELLGHNGRLGAEVMASGPADVDGFASECASKGVTHVAIDAPDSVPNQVLDRLKADGLSVVVMDELYEDLTGKLPLRSCTPERAAEWEKVRPGDVMTRLFSVVSAAVGLLMTLPLYPIIALAIWIEDPGPVFFRQERLGLNGRRFTLIKFRTMRSATKDERAGAWMKVGLADDELHRVTRIGAFLRKLRIDELPQLWNVLAGHLNAVGPRAETPRAFEERARVIEGYGSRLLVAPGMAGWGLLNHYQDIPAKLQFDMYYIKHRSFRFDLYIFMATAWQITLGVLK